MLNQRISDANLFDFPSVFVLFFSLFKQNPFLLFLTFLFCISRLIKTFILYLYIKQGYMSVMQLHLDLKHASN